MGAVFALYSAWYFWIPKILGMDYSRLWGKVHFWILFIGVNVTFFPQHFLGLQGMPRRISDYPDAFAGWNLISSFGSIVSVVATFLFLHILYVQLVEGNATSRYPWLTPQFYSDILQTILNRNYNSLEWCLTSPPKPHAFVSLPLQSVFFNTLKKGFKYFTLLNFCTGIVVLFIVTLIKYFVFGLVPIDLVQGSYLGLVALVTRLTSIGWIEMFLTYYNLEDKLRQLLYGNIFMSQTMPVDSSIYDIKKNTALPTTLAMDDPSQATSSSTGTGRNTGTSVGESVDASSSSASASTIEQNFLKQIALTERLEKSYNGNIKLGGMFIRAETSFDPSFTDNLNKTSYELSSSRLALQRLHSQLPPQLQEKYPLPANVHDTTPVPETSAFNANKQYALADKDLYEYKAQISQKYGLPSDWNAKKLSSLTTLDTTEKKSIITELVAKESYSKSCKDKVFDEIIKILPDRNPKKP